MATNDTAEEARFERAKRCIDAGATLEDAAAQCGIDAAALAARLSVPAAPADQKTKKTWSRSEVTFWLPD